MSTPLGYYCALRITPKITDKEVRSFLRYLFDGHLDPTIEREVLELVEMFREDDSTGRLVWDTTSGTLNLKEDIKK